MNSLERQREIMARLERQRSVKLSEMIAELQSSESTVRRDFECLIKSGIAVRMYGGIASTLPARGAMMPCPANVPNLAIKDALCREVSACIENGSSVFVDGGTTFLTIMQYLGQKDISVVTNNALLLADYPVCKAELIVIGGKFNSKYYISTGQLAADAVQRFQFDYALITCDAIDEAEAAAYADDVNIGSIKQLAMRRARKSILVSDSSKFHNHGLYNFAGLGEFTSFYTNPSEHLSSLPVQVIMVD